MLLMRYYKNQPLSIPQINNNNDDDDNEQPLICRIFNKYDITNNEKDIILACDIESIFGNEKKKLADELKALGVTRKKCNIRGPLRDKLVYYGIKEKVINLDDDDDNDE